MIPTCAFGEPTIFAVVLLASTVGVISPPLKAPGHADRDIGQIVIAGAPSPSSAPSS